LAHFWLGASLMITPIAAWIAIRGLEDLTTPIILGVAVLFWVAGFDILYACQDKDFDRKAKLHSVPAAMGIPGALWAAAICHAIMVFVLLMLYVFGVPAFGKLYLLGIIVIGMLVIHEHRLVRPNDLSRVNAAFFTMNGIISVGLFLLILMDQLVQRTW